MENDNLLENTQTIDSTNNDVNLNIDSGVQNGKINQASTETSVDKKEDLLDVTTNESLNVQSQFEVDNTPDEKKEKPKFKEIFKTNLANLLGTKTGNKRKIAIKATTRIAYTALLTALCTVLNIYSLPLLQNLLQLSFIVVPCFIAGIMLGPISGFAVGFLGDLIGWLIAPHGAYMPLIAISSGLFGFITGCIFLCFRWHPHLKILVSSIICLVICTSTLNTLNLWLVYSAGKTTFWKYLSLRLPFQVLVAVINCVITTFVYVCLSKAKIIKDPRSKKIKEKKVVR